MCCICHCGGCWGDDSLDEVHDLVSVVVWFDNFHHYIGLFLVPLSEFQLDSAERVLYFPSLLIVVFLFIIYFSHCYIGDYVTVYIYGNIGVNVCCVVACVISLIFCIIWFLYGNFWLPYNEEIHLQGS